MDFYLCYTVPSLKEVTMASKRQLQVAELIKRNFGIVLQQQGSYIYSDAFVTVTQVQTTPDLSLCKVYLSIYNTTDKDKVLMSIEENLHPLKQELVRRIRKHVRRIPDIAVYMDDTLDEMYKLNALFDKIDKKEDQQS